MFIVTLKRNKKILFKRLFSIRAAAEVYAKQLEAIKHTGDVVSITTDKETKSFPMPARLSSAALPKTSFPIPPPPPRLPTPEVMAQPPQQRSQTIKGQNQTQRQQAKWRKRTDILRAHGYKLPSSFVDVLEYDRMTSQVRVILGGRPYIFYDVPATVFERFYQGEAMCKTADRYWRWWKGKYPSLGAFFNGYIKDHYRWTKGMAFQRAAMLEMVGVLQ